VLPGQPVEATDSNVALVAAIARLAREAGYTAVVVESPGGLSGSVVVVELPSGQVNWLFPDRHGKHFRGLPREASRQIENVSVLERQERLTGHWAWSPR